MRKIFLAAEALAVLIVSLSVLSGCASKEVRSEGAGVDPRTAYETERDRLKHTQQISPGFELRVKHNADSSITGVYEVEFNGDLRLPYKVTVKAAGVSPDELAKKIERAYGNYFKANNSATVEIVKREYVITILKRTTLRQWK